MQGKRNGSVRLLASLEVVRLACALESVGMDE